MRMAAAFTLIELLTVMAIGAALAGMAMPAIQAARLRARFSEGIERIERLHDTARRLAMLPATIMAAASAGTPTYGVAIWSDNGSTWGAVVHGSGLTDILLTPDGRPLMQYRLPPGIDAVIGRGEQDGDAATVISAPTGWFYQPGTGKPILQADTTLSGNPPCDIGARSQVALDRVIVGGNGEWDPRQLLQHWVAAQTNGPQSISYVGLHERDGQMRAAISIYKMSVFSSATTW